METTPAECLAARLVRSCWFPELENIGHCIALLFDPVWLLREGPSSAAEDDGPNRWMLIQAGPFQFGFEALDEGLGF